MTQFNPPVIKPGKIIGERDESGTVDDDTIRTLSGTVIHDGVTERFAAGTSVDGDGGDTGVGTITGAALVSGVVQYDCNGGASAATFDDAANLQSALGLTAAYQVAGPFPIANASDAAESATLTQGTGNTLVTSGGDAVLTQGEFAVVWVMATNVTSSSEANVILALKA